MTANASINVASAPNALTVPLAGLHTATTASTPWGSVTGSAGSAAIAAGSTAGLDVDRNGKAVPIQVSVRLTNGTQAAVQPLQAGTLNAGDRVVIGFKNAQHNGKASGAAHPPMSASIGGSMRGIH